MNDSTHSAKAADPQARTAAILADAAKSINATGYLGSIVMLLCNQLAQSEPPPVDRGEWGTNNRGEAFRFEAPLGEGMATCVVYRDGYCALCAVYLGGTDVLPVLDASVVARLEDAMNAEDARLMGRAA